MAAGVRAYVDFRGFTRAPCSDDPWGGSLEPATVGRGGVNHLACLQARQAAGYDGFIALEYEGHDDESVGVPQSVAFMNEMMQGF